MILGLMLVGLSLIGCEGKDSSQDPSSQKPVPASISVPTQKPKHVGSTECRQCHQEQYQEWASSHHHGAMQVASPETVLGDFNDRTFKYFGVRSTFYTKEEKYFVRTDGQDGKLADFEITHTFGVDPLQQYLVTFPDGRLQALGIAWDTRSKTEGGERWFHLYPEEPITHTDALHWTGRNQTWNYMCADCHSTNLKKNYNLQKDQYKTTWSDITVGCEACHGPSSEHVAWANSGQAGELNSNSKPYGKRRSVLGTAAKKINTCAKCHARRSILAEGHLPGQSFLQLLYAGSFGLPPLLFRWTNSR